MSGTKITILHESFGTSSLLRKDWGFAALLEFEGQRILFDTGNNATTFLGKCSALGLDLQNLGYAVISHRNGDHTSGLNLSLGVNPKVTGLYAGGNYGVFGSSPVWIVLPDAIPCLRYFRTTMKPPGGHSPGSPWPDANFGWIKETTEGRRRFPNPVISEVQGTREMLRSPSGLRTSRG